MACTSDSPWPTSWVRLNTNERASGVNHGPKTVPVATSVVVPSRVTMRRASPAL